MKYIKPFNRSNVWQTAFSHFPYSIFPACADASAGRHLTFFFFLLPLSFLLITACPNPPETTDCGARQIEVNGDCECEEGYYWNEDETKCLMDTTSHNFVWTIDTLGEGGSYLNDVAIIDENNVWVVGKIKVPDPDSSFNGTGWETFNAAHWSGNEWELVLIDRVVDFDGVFAFSEDEIWFSDGCFIYEYDGSVFSKKWECDWETYGSGQVKEIWGSATNNLYFVGRHGSIVHYNGSTFTRMGSGTDIDLKDIWGVVNETTGLTEIWACGRTTDMNQSVLSKLHNGNWETIIEINFLETILEPPIDTIYADISSIWDDGQDSLWIIGSWGVFKMSKTDYRFRWVYQRRWDNPRPYESGYPYSIRGLHENDIFVVGQTGTVLHFNGNTWQLYREFYQPFLWLLSIDMKGNKVVLVGNTPDNKAIIIRGER